MSAPTQPLPGWYPDVTNVRRLRYFDGRHWTDEYADEFGRPIARRTAPGVPTGTVWIWLQLLLPWAAALLFLLVDWQRYALVVRSASSRDDLSALFGDPGLVVATAVGVLVPVLLVVFAALDWLALRNRRVAEPFHWAWSLLGWNIYPIGRGIVAQRRAGNGIAVTWLALTLLVVQALLAVPAVVLLVVLARSLALA